jgi:hypothetical protein
VLSMCRLLTGLLGQTRGSSDLLEARQVKQVSIVSCGMQRCR